MNLTVVVTNEDLREAIFYLNNCKDIDTNY